MKKLIITLVIGTCLTGTLISPQSLPQGTLSEADDIPISIPQQRTLIRTEDKNGE